MKPVRVRCFPLFSSFIECPRSGCADMLCKSLTMSSQQFCRLFSITMCICLSNNPVRFTNHRGPTRPNKTSPPKNSQKIPNNQPIAQLSHRGAQRFEHEERDPRTGGDGEHPRGESG